MPRTSRLLIGFAVILVLGAIAIAGTVFVLAIKLDDMGRAAGEADSAAQAYRASGWPWEAKDLAPAKPLSESQNAAPLVHQASEKLDGHMLSSDSNDIEAAIANGSLDVAARTLEPYEAALDIAVEASKKPGVDYHRDRDLGAASLFPELVGEKSLAKGLCARAELQCARHDVRGALRDLKAAWTIGSFAGDDPTLIAVLVQLAIQRAVLRSIQKCTVSLKNNRAGLEGILDVISPTRPPELGYALRGEAYLGLATVRNLKLYGGIKGLQDQAKGMSGTSGPSEGSNLVRTGLPEDRATRAYAARFMQVWVKAKQSIDKYRGQPEKLGAAMDRVVDQAKGLKEPSYAFVDLSFPAYSQAGIAIDTFTAEWLCHRAMVVALERRIQTGKLPSNIGDIPGKWTDPFTGKPLMVRNDGNSFRVYSVGPNLEDDGGVFRSELKDKSSTNYDIGAAFEPPSR